MMSKKWQVWIYIGLGLAAGHWALSYYAFVHYRTALTYFSRPPEWLFSLTLAFPQCLDRQFPPNLTAIARMLPVQSLLLAMAFTLPLSAQWQIKFRPGLGAILARSCAVILTTFGVFAFAGIALFIASALSDTRPMLDLRSSDFSTRTARIGWLNRLQPLPCQVFDTQYALQAYMYSYVPRIVQYDIAARVPSSEVDRWRNPTFGTFKPVAKDPRINEAFDALISWPSVGQWRHTSAPEFYEDGDAAYLIIYRREGIIFLHWVE